ncbi:hypothetical protein DCE93_09190 [Agromyces badenianii]|uniref:Uncharacterized protein n=1 Tax=Agromyces badenianii TaxID=2080742 RepID=A0A2S0WWU5_9MICO|nr:hypothetical protein [Agromyces badenianii]AWB95815.1 hypothetical protein DCE93_09190 [Agromyces badenianii]
MDADFGAEDFIDVVYSDVCEAAVAGVVETMLDPPGRAPASSTVQLHRWFTELPETDRAMVVRALREAADSAVFREVHGQLSLGHSMF